MKLAKWQPMELERRVGTDPFFGRIFDLLEEGSWANPERNWFPALDMADHNGSLVVRFDLPGIDPASIDLQIAGDRLTLSGERTFKSTEGTTYLAREQTYGKFSRSVQLPCHVNEKKVNATYENGVLEIALPKSEEFLGRQIPVEVKSPR